MFCLFLGGIDDQKEECDMDEITAFLEESDDENELGNDSPVEATDGKCTSIPETNGKLS